MNRTEQPPVFTMEAFDFGAGSFDINAAFQEAMHGVATDAELAVEEKVRRMETIFSEGTSDVYRSFVDFRAMTAQLNMMCNHDHALNQAVTSSAFFSRLQDGHGPDDGHDHARHTHEKDKKDEKDKKGSRKKKKKKSWMDFLLA